MIFLGREAEDIGEGERTALRKDVAERVVKIFRDESLLRVDEGGDVAVGIGMVESS